MHPYAFLWFRMIRMMAYNAYLLHRIFAVEKHLCVGVDAFKSLEQLRKTLSTEGSFASSLGDLVRGNGFQFNHPLLMSTAPQFALAPAAVALPTHTVDLGFLFDVFDTAYR
jgi:hypothetical protein